MNHSQNKWCCSRPTMKAIRDYLLLREVYSDAADFVPRKDSVYIMGASEEDRVAHRLQWERSTDGVDFAYVKEETASDFTAKTAGRESAVLLRSAKSLEGFISGFGKKNLYIDITGLAHHVWAPLLRAALRVGHRTWVAYAEPKTYKFSTTPTEGEIFDLSERIQGVSPLPGFASLTRAHDEAVWFVPLLGFEGIRLAHMIENVQPPGDRIIPVIGVPGYCPEYPFYAYQGNRTVLVDTQAWKRAKYAIANSPFSLFYLLDDIASENPSDTIVVAPIGTKPHAVGAILYAIVNASRVEIIYDHPVRKAKRTEGIDRLLVYDVSTFAKI